MATIRITTKVKNALTQEAARLYYKRIDAAVYDGTREERERVFAQQQVFVCRVEELLHGHSVLATALVEWPDLWELVPADLRTKHEQPTTKPRGLAFPGRAVAAETLQEMTGLIVQAKVINSLSR